MAGASSSSMFHYNGLRPIDNKHDLSSGSKSYRFKSTSAPQCRTTIRAMSTPTVSTPKRENDPKNRVSMIGHGLGAAGGLEAIATIKAINTRWLHPTINQTDLEPAVTIYSSTLFQRSRRSMKLTSLFLTLSPLAGTTQSVFAPFKP